MNPSPYTAGPKAPEIGSIRPPRRKAPWMIVLGVLIAMILAPVATVVMLTDQGGGGEAARALPLFPAGSHPVQMDAGSRAVVYVYVDSTTGPDGVGLSNPADLATVTPLCGMYGPEPERSELASTDGRGLRVNRDGGSFDRLFVYTAARAGEHTLSCDGPVLVDTGTTVELAGVTSVGTSLLVGAGVFAVGATIFVVGIVLTVREGRRRRYAAMNASQQLNDRW